MDRSAQPRPSGAEQHTPDYRTVAVFWTVPEAELARGLLAADGIPVASLDGADAALLPGTAPVRLQVPACDLERSRLLLDGTGLPAPAVAVVTEPTSGLGAAWSTLALAIIGLGLGLAALVSL